MTRDAFNSQVFDDPTFGNFAKAAILVEITDNFAGQLGSYSDHIKRRIATLRARLVHEALEEAKRALGEEERPAPSP